MPVFFIQPSCNTPQQLRSQANIYRLRRGGFFPVLAEVNLLPAKSPSQPIYSPGPPGDELANVPSDFWPSHWPTGPPHHPPPSQWISAGWAPMREISSFTAALIFFFLFFFPLIRGSCANKMCLSFLKKWPIFKPQIEREIARLSICHPPPPPPLPRRFSSLLLGGNHRVLAAGIYPRA